MQFIELTVTTTTDAEELVADIFWNYTEYGVAISSVDDCIKLLDSDIVYDYYDENILKGVKGVSLVKGYFLVDDANERIVSVRKDLDALKNNSPFCLGTLETVKREVSGDDWIEIWKKHFKPIKIDNVVICPEWIKYDGDEIIVKINSNLAFGTGEHETTSMVVGAMQTLNFENASVIDVGTGSGILGIVASKLGAKKVVMTEIDPVAVEVAKGNAILNGVSQNCEILCQGDLEKINETFDIGVANITAEVLTFLSNSIAKIINKKGFLVMSGLLNDREEKVEKLFVNLGFKTLSKKSVGEWTCITLQKL